MLCRECGSDMVRSIEDHPYEERGLKNVMLKNAIIHRCLCGVYALEIEDPERTHGGICCLLLSKDEPLLPDEVAFIKGIADDRAIHGSPIYHVGEA